MKHNKQDFLPRLRELSELSIFVSGDFEKEATAAENAEFLKLLGQALAQGMRFDGLDLINDDGCALCLEEKKQIVYEALTHRSKRKRSGIRTVRVDLPEALQDLGPVH
jgi:hypothetical protein